MWTKSANADEGTICLPPNGAADNSQGRRPLEPARELKMNPSQRGGATKRRPVVAEGVFTTRHVSRGCRPWLLSAAPLGRRQTDVHPAGLGRNVGESAGLLSRWLVVLVACALVAHGCHVGDHGEADLLIRIIAAAGSGPAAASP